MIRLLYSALITLSLPWFFLRFWRLSLSEPEYRLRWRERLGRPTVSPARSSTLVWIHAVSVGEVQAAHSLVRRWHREDESIQFLVTTTTPAASVMVQGWKVPVLHQYMPFDLVSMTRPLFLHYKPRLIVLMETEIWPNLVQLALRSETPIVVANARLSDSSARGYRRFNALTRPAFAALTGVLAQTERDAANFRACGVSGSRVQVTGSIKYDLALSETQRDQLETLRECCVGRPVIVAGSIHTGEEELVLNAFRALTTAYPDVLLILAPRHKDRFGPVADRLDSLGLRYCRRSEHATPGANDQVWLLDTVGELPVFYGLGTIALVGGSWIDRGGHNLIEPASLGVPVVTGPSSFNFQEVANTLRDAGVMHQVKASQLTGRLLSLLQDETGRAAAGARGQAMIARNQGATRRQVAALIEAMR